MISNGNKEEYAKQITLSYITSIKRSLKTHLQDPFLLNKKYGQVTSIKSESHSQYQLDNLAQSILDKTLKKARFKGVIFSEEVGWYSFGDYKDLKLICDPFDSTFLTTRAVNFPAVSLCFVDRNNEFVCCAIADLNSDIIYFANNTGAYALKHNHNKWLFTRKIFVSNIEDIEKAFVVLPTMQPNRRANLEAEIFRAAWYWLNACGATFIGKIASGYIDAYLDPFKGQPLYEIACAEIIVQAGGVVSNKSGQLFELSSVVSLLEKDSNSRYSLVAASTKKLHSDILKLL